MQSASDIIAHYASVRARLWRPQKNTIPARVRLARTLYVHPIGPTKPIRRGITSAAILAALSSQTGIKDYELAAPSRTAIVVRARNAGYLVARRKTKKSLPQIGEMFGGKDHTTVLHGIRRAEAWEAEDPSFAALVENINAELEWRT
jgi:chromosomal replication initiation ATPase DnaA